MKTKIPVASHSLAPLPHIRRPLYANPLKKSRHGWRDRAETVIRVHPESLFFPDGYTWLFSIRKQTILKKIKEIKEVY